MQAGIRYFGVTRGHPDDGRALGRDDVITEVYERLVTGIGDAVMLRPAIIARIEKYPERRHVAHIWSGVAPMLFDIENMEVVPIVVPQHVAPADRALACSEISRKLIRQYANPIVHQLSTPCAEYEAQSVPYEKIDSYHRRLKLIRCGGYFRYRVPRLRVEYVNRPVRRPTGRKVELSRQEIFCRELDVTFSRGNYRVKFTTAERKFADAFLEGVKNPVGIQMRSAEQWRDYRYMVQLVEYIAKHHDGDIVTFDRSWRYTGKYRNVRSLINPNLRNVWAVISRMKLFIGPDSSGGHMAGSTGVPTYGLFGPTDPRCRLLYDRVSWPKRFNLFLLRRLRCGCGYQYCWYTPCKSRACLNTRLPRYYWRDAVRQLGRYL